MDMAAPETATITAAGLLGLTVSWAVGLDGTALVGAFTGSAMFVALSSEFGLIQRAFLLFVSWAFGYNTPALLHGLLDNPFISSFSGGLLCVALSSTLLEGVKTGKLPAWLRFIRSGGK